MKKIIKIFKTNQIEIGIYNFLIVFHKTNNLDKAIEAIKIRLNCDDEYARYIVSECVKSNYFDGINISKSVNHCIFLDIRQHMYISRVGYQFIHNYRIDKFNFFWIPLKNLIIILLTAIITVLVTNSLSDSKQSLDIGNHIFTQDMIHSKICNNSKY